MSSTSLLYTVIISSLTSIVPLSIIPLPVVLSWFTDKSLTSILSAEKVPVLISLALRLLTLILLASIEPVVIFPASMVVLFHQFTRSDFVTFFVTI